MEFKHEPVLLKECIQALEIKKDGIYVDGTLGGAGHSEEILKNLSENGKLIGKGKKNKERMQEKMKTRSGVSVSQSQKSFLNRQRQSF